MKGRIYYEKLVYFFKILQVTGDDNKIVFFIKIMNIIKIILEHLNKSKFKKVFDDKRAYGDESE